MANNLNSTVTPQSKRWITAVTNDVNDKLQQFSNHKISFKYSSKNWRAFAAIMLSAGLLFLVFTIYFLAASKSLYGVFLIVDIVFLVIGALLFLIGIIFYVKWYTSHNYEQKILKVLDFQKYYQLAFLDEFAGKIELDNISTNFKIAPNAFVPREGKIRVDRVLNLHHRNFRCSFGTLTQEIRRSYVDSHGRRRTTYYWNRFPFLNSIISNKNIEVNAVIKSAKSFLKIFKTKDNTDLESSEFEKMYAVDADDQIMIRKLLVPKVIANLIDLGNTVNNIPQMNFTKNYLTYGFEKFSVGGWQDPTGVLAGIDLKGNWENIPNDICNKIIADLQYFRQAFEWVAAYDLIGEDL